MLGAPLLQQNVWKAERAILRYARKVGESSNANQPPNLGDDYTFPFLSVQVFMGKREVAVFRFKETTSQRKQ